MDSRVNLISYFNSTLQSIFNHINNWQYDTTSNTAAIRVSGNSGKGNKREGKNEYLCRLCCTTLYISNGSSHWLCALNCSVNQPYLTLCQYWASLAANDSYNLIWTLISISLEFSDVATFKQTCACRSAVTKTWFITIFSIPHTLWPWLVKFYNCVCMPQTN